MKPYRPAPYKLGAFYLDGVPVHNVNAEEVYRFIEQVILRDEKALVLNVNIHCVNLAWQHSWLRDFLNEALLVFCDGDGVRWGLRILGYPPPPKITYDRWVWQLVEFCDKKRFSLFFLGAKPGVAEQAARNAKAKYPGLLIAGIHDGYFSKEGEENEKAIAMINRIRPDILVLGLGMPLQEKWLKENWQRLHAHIFLTGGAVFDYVAGLAKRAPAWMIRCHLEWFFRLIQEPKRLFVRYAFGIPYFFFRIFVAKLSKDPKKP